MLCCSVLFFFYYVAEPISCLEENGPLRNVNTHLCHHPTPVRRGPAGRLLSLWMMWTLATINPLPQQPWTFCFEIGLWVVWVTKPGKDQCWVSRDYILSQGYRHQSCHLERGKRRLGLACSSVTPDNPERCRQISHHVRILWPQNALFKKSKQHSNCTSVGSDTCICVSGGALITMISWSGESNDFLKSWQRTYPNVNNTVKDFSVLSTGVLRVLKKGEECVCLTLISCPFYIYLTFAEEGCSETVGSLACLSNLCYVNK